MLRRFLPLAQKTSICEYRAAMKTRPECVPCLIDDVVGAVTLLTQDDSEKERVIRACLAYLGKDFSTAREPSAFITGLHRIVKHELGLEMPFREKREACNRVGLAIADWLKGELNGVPESQRFQQLILWAIAGNMLDFRTVGTGYGFSVDAIRDMLAGCVENGLAVDETDRIWRTIEGSERIVYVLDNVGEIALDALLIRFLVDRGHAVTAPLRGGPITSDAVLSDGEMVNLEATGARVICAGPDTLGISFEEMSAELRHALGEADLVLGKGQANFYVLSEHVGDLPCPAACLLTTKCDFAAGYFGQKGKVNVAALLEAP